MPGVNTDHCFYDFGVKVGARFVAYRTAVSTTVQVAGCKGASHFFFSSSFSRKAAKMKKLGLATRATDPVDARGVPCGRRGGARGHADAEGGGHQGGDVHEAARPG